MRAFEKFRIAIVVTGAVAIVAIPLRAEPSDDEKKALDTAEQSFKDGAFDLCNSRIASLLKKYPKSELAAQAEVLQARALYQLGRSDAALITLNIPISQVSDALEADIFFWQAESLLDLGKWPEAEQKYRALLGLKTMNDHLDAANLGLAWALFKQGKEADALPLIQALIKDKGGTTSGQQAQLLLAKVELAKKQFKEAIAGFEALLGAKPEKGVAFETDYWLGETYAANGQPDQAVIAYQRITSDPQAFPKSLVARAWLGLGNAQHALQQNDQAMLAYEQTYHLTENETTRLDAFRDYLECARASRQLPEAVAKLQEFAKTTDPSAPAALFAIGSVLAEDKEDDKAIGILESLLVVYGSSPWVPAANGQLGQLYARTGKVNQAIKALNNCISTSADPELVRASRFQLGYVLLKQAKDYAGAAAQFAQISDGADPSAENASYNYLLALAYMGKNDIFTKAEADFEKRFPKSSYLKFLALTEGQLLAAAGKTVLISDYFEYYRLAAWLTRYTTEPIALTMGVSSLQELFDEHFYTGLEGGILEAFGKLFTRDLRIYVYPLRDPSTKGLTKVENVEMPKNVQSLYRHVVQGGSIRQLDNYDESVLHIFSRDILKRIKSGDSSWYSMVPAEIAEVIRKRHFFGYHESEEMATRS